MSPIVFEQKCEPIFGGMSSALASAMEDQQLTALETAAALKLMFTGGHIGTRFLVAMTTDGAFSIVDETHRTTLSGWFQWGKSDEGHDFWSAVNDSVKLMSKFSC
tara:strand:- start:8510 stop:8824 length:315 start_codon:yes stop_codon:yes gene_type:complete